MGMQAYGIPKRANYCTTRESAQGWTPYAPRHRGLQADGIRNGATPLMGNPWNLDLILE